jgi:hypothetical protein
MLPHGAHSAIKHPQISYQSTAQGNPLNQRRVAALPINVTSKMETVLLQGWCWRICWYLEYAWRFRALAESRLRLKPLAAGTTLPITAHRQALHCAREQTKNAS